jgi:polyphosphate:AMP phosphotransferase
MFQAAELGRSVSKADFEAELPALRSSILAGQQALRNSKQSVLVIIEGMDGSGRAELLNRLYGWLDPRGLLTHTFWNPSDEEQDRPPFWRFWRALPAKGNLCIHLGSWYRDLITDAVNGKLSASELALELKKRHDFEEMLALEGVIILKFGLYIPESAQRERLAAERTTADDRWGEKGKKAAIENREAFLNTADQVMRQTDSPCAPWHLIEATCPRYRDLTVGKTIARAMLHTTQWHEAWLREAKINFAQVESAGSPALPEAASARVTALDKIDLTREIEKDKYRKKLEKLQQELSVLGWEAWKEKITTVIVFEGWDAAGKGGAIRRVTEGLDARLYRAVQYGAPTEEERKYPYLWRFWRELPRDGQVLIYDRSWYGRVLVERVEGFADTSAWSRAYGEINAFESELVEDGSLVIKFWLHISPDEQLRRFKEREATPYKQHKITEEDWRNREKWTEYTEAVSDMIARTGTDAAPWVLVSAENKYLARIEVLQTVVNRLKKALADKLKQG